MVVCCKCGKEIGFWSKHPFQGKNYCSKCLPSFKEMYAMGKAKAQEKAKVKKESQSKVEEYKRKCNQCGKIWHSLVSDEKSLKSGTILDALVGIGTGLSGDLGASTQSRRNAQAQEEKATSLKRCPKCGSSDYTEEIITFKKK